MFVSRSTIDTHLGGEFGHRDLAWNLVVASLEGEREHLSLSPAQRRRRPLQPVRRAVRDALEFSLRADVDVERLEQRAIQAGQPVGLEREHPAVAHPVGVPQRRNQQAAVFLEMRIDGGCVARPRAGTGHRDDVAPVDDGVVDPDDRVEALEDRVDVDG